jgi:hypothetical protein
MTYLCANDYYQTQIKNIIHLQFFFFFLLPERLVTITHPKTGDLSFRVSSFTFDILSTSGLHMPDALKMYIKKRAVIFLTGAYYYILLILIINFQINSKKR